MKTKFILLILLLIFVIPNYLKSESSEPGSYINFNGTIGDHQTLSLSIFAFGDGTIKGDYYDDATQKPVLLNGRWVNQKGLKLNSGYFPADSKITLREISENGETLAVFEGEMVEKEHSDNIEGLRTDLKINKKSPFVLQLESMTYGEYGHRYTGSGTIPDSKIDDFARTLKDEILAGEKEQVVQKIQFPLSVCIGNKGVEIKNGKQFIKKYNLIMTPNYIKLIKAAKPYHMFSNYQGVMFGESGAIWLWPGDKDDLKIITINNCDL